MSRRNEARAQIRGALRIVPVRIAVGEDAEVGTADDLQVVRQTRVSDREVMRRELERQDPYVHAMSHNYEVIQALAPGSLSCQSAIVNS